MSENFIIKLISPTSEEKQLKVKSVKIRGEDGEFGILANHADFIFTVECGDLLLVENTGEKQRLFTSGGILDMTSGVATLISEEIYPMDDLFEDLVQTKLTDAEEMMLNTDEDVQKLAIREKEIANSMLLMLDGKSNMK